MTAKNNFQKSLSKKSVFLIILAAPFLINWGSEPDKKGVKFYGKLTTQQDNTFLVDNITVTDGRKTKSIPMYEKPKDGKPDNKNIIPLTVDPRTELAHSSVDLREIAEVSVPNPREIWLYKKEGSHREIQYIEIIVTDKGGTQTPYLMDYETKVYCEKVDEVPVKEGSANTESSAQESKTKNGSTKENSEDKESKSKEHVATEMSMSLPAIKKITFEGCHSDETPCKKGSN